MRTEEFPGSDAITCPSESDLSSRQLQPTEIDAETRIMGVTETPPVRIKCVTEIQLVIHYRPRHPWCASCRISTSDTTAVAGWP